MDYNRTLRFANIFAHFHGGGQYGGLFDGYECFRTGFKKENYYYRIKYYYRKYLYRFISGLDLQYKV